MRLACCVALVLAACGDDTAEPPGGRVIEDPLACGEGMRIELLQEDGVDFGRLDGESVSNVASPCGGGAGAPGVAYEVILTEPKVLVATTERSTADTVIDIRAADCDAEDASLACNDNADALDTTSRVTASLPAGRYYVVVEGVDDTATGLYRIAVDLFPGEGTPCTGAGTECGPGLVCRTPLGGSSMICTQPQCNDGVDDDGDGKIDFPLDPGCASPTDDDELDDCPTGASCPQCANGFDDDGDGAIDYPADPSCTSAGGVSETCDGERDPIGTITAAQTLGTLVGAHDDHDPSCGDDGSPDVVYTLRVPELASLTIDTDDSQVDTLLSLLEASCAEPSLACVDDGGATMGASKLERTNVPAGTYIVAIDAFSGQHAPAPFVVNVSGVIRQGGSCDPAVTLGGAFACPASNACIDINGALRCRPSACANGLDDDLDGKIDYPAEPGCATLDDDDETDTCPGPGCPACADGLDNDNDGAIDYPADLNCVAASGTTESCVSTEAVTPVTAPATAGTTAGAANDFHPSCAAMLGGVPNSGPDVYLQLDLPAVTSLDLDLTAGFDTVHVLLGASCALPELVCRDPLNLHLGALAAGRYHLVVDGWGPTESGAFSLATSGKIAPGGSCESALALSGALTCGTGYTCAGAPGARTCQAGECGDGVDNNADGKIDFPADPGCASVIDPLEDTVCPGANCPICSNTLDDDNDLSADWPADFGCRAASGTTELFCPTDLDFGGLIAAPTTAGTLAGKSNNGNQSCQMVSTSNDLVYALRLPVPVATLVVDTVGSTNDTILSVRDAACGAEFACNDDISLAMRQSRVTISNLPRNNYAIIVDSFDGLNNLPFVLNVRGTVAPGTACTDALFTAGVLVCPSGTACTAGVCQ